MIKIDFSKAVPTSAFRHLAALIPGGFLLVCLALGNTCLTAELSTHLQSVFPFGQFASIFVAIFLAFVIGLASINLVLLIQHLLMILYKPYFLFRGWLRERVLLPILNRILNPSPLQPGSPPPKPKPRWLLNFRSRTFQRIYSPQAFDRAIFMWWEAIAEQLLRTRYGMKDDHFPNASRQPLVDVLTTPTLRELRGNLMVVALHATGWTALVASRFAPDLRVTWFYLFAFLLIGTGLHHDYFVAEYRRSPALGATIRLRALLREFPEREHQTADRSELGEDGAEDT